MSISQLTFSGVGASIGDAKIFASIQTGGSLTNQLTTNDLAPIVFDGSGDSSSHSCTITIDSSTAALYVNNYGSITTATTSVNNIGQIIFDGSGGSSRVTAGTGSSEVIILGDTLLVVDNANGQTIGNGYEANNTTQILFDGSGGLSKNAGGIGQSTVTVGGNAQLLATLTESYIQSQGIGNDVAQIAFEGSGGTSLGAGGTGSSTVILEGSAVISATAPSFGYPGYYSSGSTNDTAQILFSGSGGLSYGGAGQGSSSVTITDAVTLIATNTYYLAGTQSQANDFAQILFDGSGGAGISQGGTGSATVTINGSVQMTATNIEDEGYMYTSSAYVNDLAQILFDGTPGLNYAGMGSGFCSVTISENVQMSALNQGTVANDEYTNDVGQIVFDGSHGFGNAEALSNGVVVLIEGDAILSATNTSSGTLKGGYGNSGGQIIFDGSGGFSYDHAGAGSAQVTLQGGAQIVASNAGSLVGNSSTLNDIAQIIFNGSGGASGGTGGSNHSTGTCTVSVDGTVTLEATNSGNLGNTASNAYINNIAQILLDGSGGVNSDGGGRGHLTATIATSTPIRAVNASGGLISNIDGSSSNKIGQIIFDGSKGLNTSFESSGELTATFGNGASISASNSGTISTVGTAQGIGQILFDGGAGSSGSGSCVIQFGTTNTIVALNTATGVIDGDQIAFYDTIIEGNATVKALNEGGSITHGVAFYGSTTTADNVNIQLSGSSLWIDATTSSSFAIGSLSGDASSTAVFNQTTTINPSSDTAAVFAGDISGSGEVKITGTGQQIFSGSNTYTGETIVSSGLLTLRSSNIPGTLFVGEGGTFSGVGIISGTATVDGTIRPGNSPGTLQFENGLTLSSSAITQIEVDISEASLLAVSGGNAQIAGTLEVLEDTGVRAGTTYPIVTVNGGDLIGTFKSITNTGNLIPVVFYSNDEVTLTLENPPSSFASLLMAPDRILRNIETLKHLDNRRHDIFDTFKSSPSEAKKRLEVAKVGDSLAEAQKSHQRETKAIHESQKPWSAYLEPTGSFGHVKSRKNVLGNTFQTIGARAGFDYLWTDENNPDTSGCYGLGMIGEYNHWWGQQSSSAGTFASDVAYGSIYGTFVPKAIQELSVNGIAGGGYSWYAFHRNPLGSASLQAKGYPGGAQADALLDIEYVFHHKRFGGLPKNFCLIPSLALQYTYTRVNSYRESGAGIYDLRVDGQTTMTLSSLLGFRSGYLFFEKSSITLCPELMAEWQYQYLDSSIDAQCSTFATASSGEFPFTIPGFSRNSLIAGADIRVDIHKKVTVQLNYDLWYNQRGIINFFLLECRSEF
jgi:autotransporter-associated beta strand protein